MAGLVGYASSDEESDQEEVQQSPPATSEANSQVSESKVSQSSEAPKVDANGSNKADEAQEAEAKPAQPAQAVGCGPARPPAGPSLPPPEAVVYGPARPPAAGAATLPSLDDDEDTAMAGAFEIDDDEYREPSLSPSSDERAAIRELTMPRVPDFDIPGGDDDDGGQDDGDDESKAALVKKFATFLKLREHGKTYFNERLAGSDAMKNPALMDKLMAYIGLIGVGVVDEEPKGAVDTKVAAAPYGTTLPAEIWDPAALPAEAYRRSLQRLQEDAAKQRARAPGEPVSFVSATAEAPSESSSTAATAAAGPGKRKSRFDQN